MDKNVLSVCVLLSSMALIIIAISKVKAHPFLALLLASFYAGAAMGMKPLAMVNAIEDGIGGTLGFLAAVIGLGTILGTMMEVSGGAERIGNALQKCRWLSPDVAMVLIGILCGITLFVEVGVVLLIPLAFSIAKNSNVSLFKLSVPLCTALMAVHCVLPPHPAALYVTNALGANIGVVIAYGLVVCLAASLIAGPLFFRRMGALFPFKTVPPEYATLQNRRDEELPSLGTTLFTALLPIALMLTKTAAELIMERGTPIYELIEFIGSPIVAMFISALVACFVLGIRRKMGREVLLLKTEHGFSSIANVLLIIGAGGAFNSILKESGLADTLAVLLSGLNIHPILLAWIVAIVLHAAVGSATVAMMGATAIVAPLRSLYPDLSPEILTLAIGSGAIGGTIVTDSLFWLIKQYCGASLSETFKTYTMATLIASLVALSVTFALSYVV